jgi:hypothetical protein
MSSVAWVHLLCRNRTLVNTEIYPKTALSRKWVKIIFGSWKVVPQDAYGDLRFSWFAVSLKPALPAP